MKTGPVSRACFMDGNFLGRQARLGRFFFRVHCMSGRSGLGVGLVAFALGNDGGMDAGAKVFGKFVKLGAAIDFNGAFGCIADDIAVVAPLQMLFQLRLGVRIHGVVEVVGQLF